MSKRGNYEILIFGKNVKTFDGQTEFEDITVFENGGKITGLRIKRKDQKEMAFLPNKINWFFTDSGESIFPKIFPFGKIALSLNGESLHNYN